MLCIGRRHNESLTLFLASGETVTIVCRQMGKHQRQKMRLAIDAPDSVDVIRTELLDEETGQPPPGSRQTLKFPA